MTAPPESCLTHASALRLLWGARRLVAVGAALALLVAIPLVYDVGLGVPPSLDQRSDSVGIASSQVLVDSRSSQSVDLGTEPVLIDIPGLIARARLLANLIATSPLRDRIARRAGVDPRTFLATAPSIGFDSPKPSAQQTAGEQPSVMNVSFNEALPIVTINAEAATETAAARISTAAASELAAYRGSLTARDRVADAQQLVVKPLGGADSATVRRGPRRLTSLVVFAFLFGLWCAAIVVIRRMRLLRDAATAPVAADEVQAAFPGLVRLGSQPSSAALPERSEHPRRGVSA